MHMVCTLISTQDCLTLYITIERCYSQISSIFRYYYFLRIYRERIIQSVIREVHNGQQWNFISAPHNTQCHPSCHNLVKKYQTGSSFGQLSHRSNGIHRLQHLSFVWRLNHGILLQPNTRSWPGNSICTRSRSPELICQEIGYTTQRVFRIHFQGRCSVDQINS